jgi:hypothetical protein
MSNNIGGFLERLTAAAGDYNKAKVGELSALDAVYLDIRPEVARMGQTIRVYFPDVSAFTDQAANDWNPDDLNPGFVDVPFGQRPGKGILVRDFEQFQTSTDIIDQFIDPLYKRAQEYANGQVFNQITSTNFNVYTPITTAPAEVDIGSAKLAWNFLVRNKVPIRDSSNASILYHVDVHANTLTDPAWAQENLVSAVIAETTRRDAATPGTAANQAFKFTRRFDQQAPTASSSNLTGTVTVANGSTAVTGSSTTFLTQVAATPTAPAIGNTVWLTFGADTQAYPVANVASNTALTLAQPYQGALTSGNNFVRTTYTGVAMHKYAIALAVRPLEIVNNGQVNSRLVKIKGLPIRVQLSYQHRQSGWLLTMDYGMVCKVIRPDFGVLLVS